MNDLHPYDGHRPRPGPAYWEGYCLLCSALVDEHVKRPVEDVAAFFVFGGLMVSLMAWAVLVVFLGG